MSDLQQLSSSLNKPVKLKEDQLYRLNLGFENPFTLNTYENDLISIRRGTGVLSGHAATVNEDGEYEVCIHPEQICLGLFGLDASKEIVGLRTPTDLRTNLVLANGYHQINVYELYSYNNHKQLLDYIPGDLLYVSPFGLLTNENSSANGSRPVAIVEKVYSDEDSKMDIRIFDLAGNIEGAHNPVSISPDSQAYAFISSQNQVLHLNVNDGPNSLVTVDHTHSTDDIDGFQDVVNGIYNYLNSRLDDLGISDVTGLRDELDNLWDAIGSASDTGCCDEIWGVLNKLIPPPPAGISSLQFQPDYDWVQARYLNSGEVLERVTLDRRPGYTFQDLYEGVLGTLEAYISRNLSGNTPAGSVELTTAGNLTDDHINVYAATDFYENQSGKEDFYYVREGLLKPSSDLQSFQNNLNQYDYTLTHTEPSATFNGFGSAYVDTLPGSILVEENLTRIKSVPTKVTRFVSGVPVFDVGTEIEVQANIKNAVSNFYHKDSVILYEGEGIQQGQELPLAPPTTYGQDVFFPSVSVNVANNEFTDDLEMTLEGRNAYDDRDSFLLNFTSPIYIDTLSDESDRVYSGFGDYPVFGTEDSEYGRPFDPAQSLLLNEELQMQGGRIKYPTEDFSSNLPQGGPDYSGLTGMRWYTIKVENFNGTGANLEFEDVEGNWSGQEPTQGMKIFIRVDGDRPTYGWVNGYEPYSGVGPITNTSQGGLVKDSNTTNTVKGITFGEGDERSGVLYVRVGMLETDDKSWTNIDVTPRI